MFAEISRDLFTFPERFVRVIPVNTVGIMGAGVAKQFRIRYPKDFEDYRTWCVFAQPGMIQPITAQDGLRYLWVATKRDWRKPSQPEWIIKILNTIALDDATDWKLAMPAIGCGHGGLDYSWLREEVRTRFEQHLSVHVVLIPGGKHA